MGLRALSRYHRAGSVSDRNIAAVEWIARDLALGSFAFGENATFHAALDQALDGKFDLRRRTAGDSLRELLREDFFGVIGAVFRLRMRA